MNVGTPVNDGDASTKLYVDSKINELVNSAPGLLDTLNEIAQALGDDPNFAATITNQLNEKLNLSGGTMTGNLDMGNNSILNLLDPVNM